MSTSKELKLRLLSSLAKVLPERVCGKISKSCTAVCGQEVSFQIAYTLAPQKYIQKYYTFKVTSPLSESLTVSTVGTVPCTMASYPDRRDDNYLTHHSGAFPDPLFPCEDGKIRAASGLWRAIWISVKLPSDCPAGDYPVKVTFYNRHGEVEGSRTYHINVMPYALPAQKLLFTQWFHCDCIADVHHVSVLSEAHWSLIEKYMRLAAEYGMNMILTPVVTPPLDTAVGTERPTVQLVDVVKEGENYRFGFDKLKRFLDMARACGINHFEISHLFTQWGVTSAPKVVATVDGVEQRIFGWDTPATCDEYVGFLRQMVPALIAYLESEGIDKNHMWFHLSDEPSSAHLENYHKAAAVLKPLIEGCRQMDALSNIDFYNEGLVPTPVVATNRIVPFLEAKVPGLWCYYCCGQGVDVSNRFLAMPSARTRIIGVQMFKYGIEGFLQWGYNFYYGEHSTCKIDPCAVTDGHCTWPGGDPFSVYPHGDDVIPSLRQKVFSNALEDMRLLALLEEKLGHEAAVAELERVAGMTITFSQYPHNDEFFEDLYQMIFEKLK